MCKTDERMSLPINRTVYRVIEISFYKKVDVKICTLSCIFRTVDFYSTLVIQSSFIIQYLHNSDKKCLVFLNCFNTKYVLFDITVFGMYFSLLMDIIISMCNDFQLNLFIFFSTILLNWTCVCFLPGLLEWVFF